MLVSIVSERRERAGWGVAFAIGYLSHVASDVLWHLLSGEYHELDFLLWPFTPMPEYTETTPLGTVAGIVATTLCPEAALFVTGVALWVFDGTPRTGVRERLQG